MIDDWLHDPELAAFRARHYEREPYVQPGTAAAAVPLVDWDTVERLLVAGADLMLVRNGHPWPEGAPARQ